VDTRVVSGLPPEARCLSSILLDGSLGLDRALAEFIFRRLPNGIPRSGRSTIALHWLRGPRAIGSVKGFCGGHTSRPPKGSPSATG
jgi:hypothetical protein